MKGCLKVVGGLFLLMILMSVISLAIDSLVGQDTRQASSRTTSSTSTRAALPAVTLAPTNTPIPTDTPVPTLTPDEYKAQAITLSVRELTRDTEAYVGQIVTYSGEILQVIEDEAWLSDAVTYVMRFAVDGDYDSVIVAKLIYEDGEGWRPLESDRVSIWGQVEGRQEYKTVLGQQVIVPSVTVKYIELQQ